MSATASPRFVSPEGQKAIRGGRVDKFTNACGTRKRTTAGRAVAIIDVSDDISDYQIPLGSTAQVAIYTHHLHELSLLRKILLRMKSWQNYVFLEEGH